MSEGEKFMKKILFLFILCFAFSGSLSPAAARDEFTPDIGGFYVHNKIQGELVGLKPGTGWGVRIGAEPNKILGFEAAYFRSVNDINSESRALFEGVTAGARIKIPIKDIVAPFLAGGAGYYIFRYPSPDKIVVHHSLGTQWGYGLDIHLGSAITLTNRYMRTQIEFRRANHNDTAMQSFEAGIMVHF